MTRLLIYLVLFTILLAGCGGTLSISFETTPTPDLAQRETMSALEMRIATLEPAFHPLDLNADSTLIREAMLHSHESWQTAWLDAVITQYPQENSGPATERVQLWVDRRQGWFRVVSGPAEGVPDAMQIGDGVNQERITLPDGNRQVQEMGLSARDLGWNPPDVTIDTIEPHPMDLEIDSPLATVLFSTAFAQQDRSYSAVGMEKVAGRPALVVESMVNGQMQDRFWIDTRTGVVLRWQSWPKDSEQQSPTSEILVTKIEYDLAFPAELFDLRVSDVPQFAMDANARPVATLVPPQTGFESGAGELYFVLWTPGGSPELQLVRLPGNCVTGFDACPLPTTVNGYPNINNTIEPLIWSPQGDAALLNHQGTLYRYTPVDDAWFPLLQFPVISSPVWSSDGQWIALVAQDGSDQQDIYVVRQDGSELQNLTNGQYQGMERFLWVHGWLNDGRVLYAVMERTSAMLYAHRIGETGAVQVMDGVLQQGIVSLSADGQQAAYTSSTEQGISLWLAPLVDGKIMPEPRRLATFGQSSIAQILWTVDGSWLVFKVTSSMTDMFVETAYAIRPDGTDLHQLAQQTSLNNLSVAGTDHVIAEDADNGRLLVLSIEEAQKKVLEVPGVRLDQQMRGSSWR